MALFFFCPSISYLHFSEFPVLHIHCLFNEENKKKKIKENVFILSLNVLVVPINLLLPCS